MISSLRISFLLLLFPSSISSLDESIENISINTGETATFICDLPERYSNQAVSLNDGTIKSIYIIVTGEICMIKKQNSTSRLISMDPGDVYWSRRPVKTMLMMNKIVIRLNIRT
jgi:hypothetical protein